MTTLNQRPKGFRVYRVAEEHSEYTTILAPSADDAAAEYWRSFRADLLCQDEDYQPDSTDFYRVSVWADDWDESRDYRYAYDPPEPECAGEHAWAAHSVPDSTYSQEHQSCPHCGLVRCTDRGVRDPETGARSLTSISYDLSAYDAFDVAASCDADADWDVSDFFDEEEVRNDN